MDRSSSGHVGSNQGDPFLFRPVVVGLVAGLAAASCHSTPDPPDWVTDAPPEVGAGDCPVVVENRGIHRMEIFFHLGWDLPSEGPRSWPRAGSIDPGESVRINAVCSEEYIRVRAWVDAPGLSEDQWLAGRKRLVEGREETIRLREPP